MRISVFFGYLLAVTFGWGALVALWLWQAPGARPNAPFALATLGLFVAICLLLFLFGWRAAHSPKRMAFNGVITASVFGKMAASLAFLAVYKKLYQPEGNTFVVLFLLTYAVYTFFEVWFMTKLAKMDPTPR
jgi:ABC-type Fe3+-siderophore transport system permease subunit